jgi:hypothetical protein
VWPCMPSVANWSSGKPWLPGCRLGMFLCPGLVRTSSTSCSWLKPAPEPSPLTSSGSHLATCFTPGPSLGNSSALILLSQSATRSNSKWFTVLSRFSSDPDATVVIFLLRRCGAVSGLPVIREELGSSRAEPAITSACRLVRTNPAQSSVLDYFTRARHLPRRETLGNKTLIHISSFLFFARGIKRTGLQLLTL